MIIKNPLIITRATSSTGSVEYQEKYVTPNLSEQIVIADANYAGLSRVTIAPILVTSKSDVITANGSYRYQPQAGEYLDDVNINVNVPISYNLEENKNGTTVNLGTSPYYEIIEDEDGGVVDLGTIPIIPQAVKNIEISMDGDYTILPDTGYTAMKQVNASVNVTEEQEELLNLLSSLTSL